MGDGRRLDTNHYPTGRSDDRLGPEQALSVAHASEGLLFEMLDRPARSALNTRAIVDKLNDKASASREERTGAFTMTPFGRMFFSIFAASTKLSSSLIRSRVPKG